MDIAITNQANDASAMEFVCPLPKEQHNKKEASA